MRAVGADSVEAEPGDRFGRFEILAKLASGGMGRVYLARAKGPAGFEKTVALKTIHPDLASRPDFVEMFLDEARIAAKLEHPNVCRVFDFGQAEGTYFLAMEYLVGEPLSRVLAAIAAEDENGPRPAHTDAVLAKIVADAAEGLHAAHELLGDDGEPLELVHRDVSPHNVFVTYDGGVRIVDFGVASAGRRTSESGNELKGKLPYMSPEQVARAALDRRVDVWGLGVVLWEGYAGTTLWPARTELEVLQSIAHDPVPPLGRLRPDLPKPLVDITMRALEKDPGRRWRTTRELGQAIQRWLATRGEPIGLPEVAALMSETFPDGRAQKLALLDRMKLASADGERISGGPRPKPTQRSSTPPVPARSESATRASIPSALDRAPSVPPPRSEETVVAGRPASSPETIVGSRPVSAGTFVGPLDPQVAAQIARPVFGAGVTAQRVALTVPAAPVPAPSRPPPPIAAPPELPPLPPEPTAPAAPFAPPPVAVVADVDIVRAKPGAKWRTRLPLALGLVVVSALGAGAWWATRNTTPTEMVATPLTARVTTPTPAPPPTPTLPPTPAPTPTPTFTPTPTPTFTPTPTPTFTPTPTPTPTWATASPDRPTPDRPAPERREPRTEARTEERTGPGTVVVTTEGGWADLYVDGESVGSTRTGAARFELPPGRHSLELRPFGFRAPGPGMTRSVNVEPGGTARVRVTLEE